mmetsp:Transcript_87910/g.175853  ORF Transcript_87910/g.175853 Transcript_87910/m.175853 type:complete len:392 (+) Transcript_87910:74-1249(+)|eukprot:CAMPEP_0171941752 /NCGR_PEP_ID=MMETSP0993-20121228/38100_1 /TAXON_ID=483369 /ORGANISM="non described non described, Strain CCMP2098" /LENGTH=391 /DNA_ID=CAMNT_0012584045 /DNA_START=1 /DNA_END=1176 /DNA_ORIENTATION=-
MSFLDGHAEVAISPAAGSGFLTDILNPVSTWLSSWLGTSSSNATIDEHMPTEENVYAFTRAGFDGDERELKRLFELGTGVDSQLSSTGTTALYLACMNGHFSAARLLLDDFHADPTIADEDGVAPIHVAAYHSSDQANSLHGEIIAMLISDYGVDANEQDLGGGTPILMASLVNSCKVIRILLKLHGDPLMPNFTGETALYLAAQEGNDDVIRVLTQEAGVTDLNVAITLGGWTPVYASAQHNHLSTTELLLSSGADVNLVDHAGNAPLHVGAMQGYTGIVALLCAHGADINVANKEGDTSLLMATKDGHNDVIEILVEEYGADPSTPDKDGYTPIYVAAQEGHNSTLALLVRLGADPCAPNKAGDTPMDAALQLGLSSTVEALTQLATKD